MLPKKYGGRNRGSRHNFHINTKHVQIILKEAEKCLIHWKVFLHILAFTGIRVCECCAIHISDFPGSPQLNFTKLRVRRAKSGKEDTIHVIKPVSDLIRGYVLKKKERIEKGGGWLFPSTNKKRRRKGRPWVNTGAAEAMFSKLRMRAGNYCPDFSQRYGGKNKFYRIRLHSLRHWVGTMAHKITKDPAFVKTLLGHANIETTYKYYVDYEQVSERMPQVMEEEFAPFLKHNKVMGEGQQTLSEY